MTAGQRIDAGSVSDWIARVVDDPGASTWTIVTMIGLTLIGGGLLLIVGSATGRVAQIMFRRRKDTEMDQDRQITGPAVVADEDAPRPAGLYATGSGETTEQWWTSQAGNETDAAPISAPPIRPEDSGVHALPDPVRGVRVACAGCGGHGYVMTSVSDLLRESAGFLGDGGDVVVKEFYSRLLDAAPHLASVFPADLLGADTVKGQRDKLLKAITALADLYNPDDPAAMARLDTALSSYGRMHAMFARPNGEFYGATFDEYKAVKDVLFQVFHDAVGDRWLPEHDQAWSEAYDYAAVHMLFEQYRAVLAGEFTMPRFPREAR